MVQLFETVEGTKVNNFPFYLNFKIEQGAAQQAAARDVVSRHTGQPWLDGEL
jgi:hypothetical protein